MIIMIMIIIIIIITGKSGEYVECEQQYAEYKWICAKHASGNPHNHENLDDLEDHYNYSESDETDEYVDHNAIR